jgi:hypothetical protein
VEEKKPSVATGLSFRCWIKAWRNVKNVKSGGWFAVRKVFLTGLYADM